MYCHKCGKEMKEEDNFCPECGAKNVLNQYKEPAQFTHLSSSVSKEEMESLNRSLKSILNGVKNLNLYVRIAIPIITSIIEIICRSKFVTEWFGMGKGDWTRTTHYYISGGGAFFMILLLLFSIFCSGWLVYKNKNISSPKELVKELPTLPGILTIISVILTWILIFGISEFK